MLGKIKGAIQDRLYQSCIEEYERDLRCQTDPYLVWVQENELRTAEKWEQSDVLTLALSIWRIVAAGFLCLISIKSIFCLCLGKVEWQ